MSAFPIQRIALVNGAVTPITPPVTCAAVQIINLTGLALRLYSTSGNDATYLEIADDFFQEIDLHAPRFRYDEIAFYLKSAADGTVVLMWR